MCASDTIAIFAIRRTSGGTGGALPRVLTVVTLVAAGLGVVERGVADEEAGREQLEADRVDRHDRPVLGTGHVVGAEGEPEHHVGVGEVSLPRGEGGQACAAGCLVRVVAGGEQLVPVVGGDPERAEHERRAPGDGGARVREGPDHVVRQQLVGDGLAEFVLDVVVDDLPVAARERVGLAPGHGLVGDEDLPRPPGVADRVLRARRVRGRGDLVDPVGGAVDRHVQADVEEVLVVRTVDAGGDDDAVLGLDTLGHGAVGDHAGELDLVLDRAVLVQVPVIGVLVVAHGDDARDDHAGASA